LEITQKHEGHFGSDELTEGGSWTVFLDMRSKKDIVEYTNGLNEIMLLNPVRFTFEENFYWGSGNRGSLITPKVVRCHSFDGH
jgi:hypothetical protein